MAWKIVNGRPIQVEVRVGLTPPEVDGLTCPVCGKDYKTERGYENHLLTH